MGMEWYGSTLVPQESQRDRLVTAPACWLCADRAASKLRRSRDSRVASKSDQRSKASTVFNFVKILGVSLAHENHAIHCHTMPQAVQFHQFLYFGETAHHFNSQNTSFHTEPRNRRKSSLEKTSRVGPKAPAKPWSSKVMKWVRYCLCRPSATRRRSSTSCPAPRQHLSGNYLRPGRNSTPQKWFLKFEEIWSYIYIYINIHMSLYFSMFTIVYDLWLKSTPFWIFLGGSKCRTFGGRVWPACLSGLTDAGGPALLCCLQIAGLITRFLGVWLKKYVVLTISEEIMMDDETWNIMKSY